MLVCTTTIVVNVDAVIAAFLTLLLELSESFGICLVMEKITAQPKVSVFPLMPTDTSAGLKEPQRSIAP